VLQHQRHALLRGPGPAAGPRGPPQAGLLLLPLLLALPFLHLLLLLVLPGAPQPPGPGRAARARAQRAPPGGPLPAVGLQGLQEEDHQRGPAQGGHAARAPAARQGERRVRVPEAVHVGQPQPTAAEGGDSAQRHQLHRVPAGAAARRRRRGAGRRRLLPGAGALQRGLGRLQPAVQLLRRHGEFRDRPRAFTRREFLFGLF